jgi:glycosyltransferase involved in cell wall biosynthesis
VHVRGSTLADARNEADSMVDTEWVIHLDADDELEPGYVEAMTTSTADIRVPALRYVTNGQGRARMPRVAGHSHLCGPACLTEGNWVCVGACARVATIRKAGGWWGEPIYEDWSLWLRCHLAGASFASVPDAVYRAHVRPDSRNFGATDEERVRVTRNILRSVLPAAGVAR